MRTFLNILSGVGIILWCLCFCLGFNFQQEKPSIILAALLALFIAVVLGVLVFLLKKVTSSSIRSNTNLRTERIALAVYGVVALLSCGSIIHFVHVYTTVKDEVVPLASHKIDDIKRAYGSEEDVLAVDLLGRAGAERISISHESAAGSYLSYVADKLGGYQLHLKKDMNFDVKTMQVKMTDFIDKFTGEEFQVQRHEVLQEVELCELAINQWNPFTVNGRLLWLDKNHLTRIEDLVQHSKNTDYIRQYPDEYYTPTINEQVKNVSLAGKLRDGGWATIGALSIILILILQVMILFTYFAYRTSNRSSIKDVKIQGIGSYDPNRRNVSRVDEGASATNERETI